jgi:hypothetical protein
MGALVCGYANFERIMRDAPSLGIALVPVEAEFGEQYAEAFATVIRERADALFVDSTNAAAVQIHRLVSFASQQRLPVIYPSALDRPWQATLG